MESIVSLIVSGVLFWLGYALTEVLEAYATLKRQQARKIEIENDRAEYELELMKDAPDCPSE
jgi:hypothetical protein